MKKKAIISILLVFVIMITSIPVFADIPIPAIPSDAWEYWAVVERKVSGKTQFELFTSHNPITAPTSGTLLYMNTCRTYVLIDGEWINDWESLSSGNSASIVKVYASSHNIAYDNAPGFFFTVPSQSELYRTMKRMDSGILLTNILAGLTPLLGCVILGICLMKGLAYLRNQLMR